MDNANKQLSRLFFDPFTYLSKNQTLVIGLTIILITGFINSFTNTHFDGIFDIHTGKSSAFVVFVTEGYIILILLTGLLFLIGTLFIKQRANIFDLFGSASISTLAVIIIKHHNHFQTLSTILPYEIATGTI